MSRAARLRFGTSDADAPSRMQDTADRPNTDSCKERTFIYALCEPGSGEVRYVGKADDPTKRLKQHVSRFRYQKPSHKNNWVQAVLRAGQTPTLMIIEEVPYAEWREAERSWIRQLVRMGCRLTNTTPGGEGHEGLTADGRRRIGAAHRGPRSAEWRAHLSAAGLARTDVRRPPHHNGELNPKAKLTDEKVAWLRAEFKAGTQLQVIADELGVTRQAVWFAAVGRTWRHVSEPPAVSLGRSQSNVNRGARRRAKAEGQ